MNIRAVDTTLGERSDGMSAPGVALKDVVRFAQYGVIRDGFLVPSDAPGFGIETDREGIDVRR